jgi:hypothetical protein
MAPPIRVRTEGSRWIVDFGGGITMRFVSRDDAVATAQAAAKSENRELDLAS